MKKDTAPRFPKGGGMGNVEIPAKDLI